MNNIKFDFKGKTILITAGTKGIGFELTKSFLDCGANVATFSRNRKNHEILSKKLKNYVFEKKLFIFKHDLNQTNKEKLIAPNGIGEEIIEKGIHYDGTVNLISVIDGIDNQNTTKNFLFNGIAKTADGMQYSVFSNTFSKEYKPSMALIPFKEVEEQEVEEVVKVKKKEEKKERYPYPPTEEDVEADPENEAEVGGGRKRRTRKRRGTKKSKKGGKHKKTKKRNIKTRRKHKRSKK